MNNAEFSALRRNGIGGSDVAPILNLSPYSNAYKIYLEKISNNVSEELEDGELYWGKIFEPVFIKEFEK